MYVIRNIKTIELQGLKGSEEALWVKLQRGKGKSICIGLIYRSPSQGEDMDGDLIEDICSIAMKQEVLLIGDFNMTEVDWQIPTAVSCRSKEILDYLQGKLFWQLVTEPTYGTWCLPIGKVFLML